MADVAPGGRQVRNGWQSHCTMPGEQVLKMLSFLLTRSRSTTNTKYQASQKDCSLLISIN